MSTRSMTVAGSDERHVGRWDRCGRGTDIAIPPNRRNKNAVRMGHPHLGQPKLTLLAHEAFPFPAALREAVLAAMDAKSTSTAELARLNWRLGLAYAEAVKKTARRNTS